MSRLVVVAVMLVLVSGVAAAGYASTAYVVVNTTYRYANGAMSAARHSPDTNQHIGCETWASTYGTDMMCRAVDAQGRIGYCFAYSPNMIEAVRGLTSSSFLAFGWDASGVCTYVQVSNLSDYISH